MYIYIYICIQIHICIYIYTLDVHCNPPRARKVFFTEIVMNHCSMSVSCTGSLKVLLHLFSWSQGSFLMLTYKLVPQFVNLELAYNFHSTMVYGRYIYTYIWLVVWNIRTFLPQKLGTIIPIDFHIFQMGRSTTNQIWFINKFITGEGTTL